MIKNVGLGFVVGAVGLLVGCGSNAPGAASCADCGGESAGGSAGSSSIGGKAAMGGAAGNHAGGAGTSGGAAGGANSMGGAAGRAGTCTGTPTASCSAPACDLMPGCVATTPSSCAGTATPCSELDDQAAQCNAQAGCGITPQQGYCDNQYGSCDDFGNSLNTCNELSGCQYNGIQGTCLGTIINCNTVTSEAACGAQLACQWVAADKQYCEGAAAKCAQLTAGKCAAQQGCTVTPGVCTGTPTPCAELTGPDCSNQPGCALSGGGGSGGSGGTPAALPDLAFRVSVLGVVKDDKGASVFDFGFEEINRGSAVAAAHEDDLFVSTDNVLGNADDVLILSTAITGPLDPYGTSFIQEAEAHYAMSTFTDVVPSGYYYIGFVLDGKGVVAESDETNNAIISDRVFIGTPTIDLVAVSVTTDAAAIVAPGDSFNVSVTLKNQSNVDLASIPINVVLSSDTTIDGGDTALCTGASSATSVAPGAQTVVQIACTAPRLRGTYYLGAQVDPSNSLADVALSNNSVVSTSTVHINAPSPDLVISAADIDSTEISWQGNVGFSATAKNTGVDPAGAFKVAFYLSKDAALDSSDTKICELSVASLAAGATSDVSQSCKVPAAIIGQRRVIALADSADAVFETNETNNAFTAAATLTVDNPDWDLALGNVADNAGDTLVSEKTGITYQVVVNNNGTDPIPSFDIAVYLSTDSIITTGDTLVCSHTVTSIGASTNATITFQCDLPTLSVGTNYYTGFVVDPDNTIVETDETNNRAASSSSRPAVAGP